MSFYINAPAECIPVGFLEKRQQYALENDKPLVANWYNLEVGIATQDTERIDHAQLGFATHAIRSAAYENSLFSGGTSSANLALLSIPHFRARAERQPPANTLTDAYYASLGTLALHTARGLLSAPEIDISARQVVERLGTLCTFAALFDKASIPYVSSPREMKGNARTVRQPYHDLYTLRMEESGLCKVPIITYDRDNTTTIYGDSLNSASSMQLPFSSLVWSAKLDYGAPPALTLKTGLEVIGRFLRQDINPLLTGTVDGLLNAARAKHQQYTTQKANQLLYPRRQSPKTPELPTSNDPHARFLARLAIDSRQAKHSST